MTAQWEHLTVHIRWDAEQKQWQSDWPGSCPHDAINGILDQISATGWELVSFFPFTATILDSPLPGELNQRFWATMDYQAIFKRHKP